MSREDREKTEEYRSDRVSAATDDPGSRHCRLRCDLRSPQSIAQTTVSAQWIEESPANAASAKSGGHPASAFPLVNFAVVLERSVRRHGDVPGRSEVLDTELLAVGLEYVPITGRRSKDREVEQAVAVEVTAYRNIVG